MDVIASALSEIDVSNGHAQAGDCVLVDGTELGEFQYARRERGNNISCLVWTERGGFRAVSPARVSLCEA